MNKKINIRTIIILLFAIVLVLTLIILNAKNFNIEKQITDKEQLTQTTSTNAYISMSDHLSKLNNI